VPERTRLYRFNFEMNFKTEFSWSVKQWSDSPTDQQCTCVTFKRPLPARHTTVLSIFTLCSNRCWRCLYQMNELFLSLHYKRDPLTAQTWPSYSCGNQSYNITSVRQLQTSGSVRETNAFNIWFREYVLDVCSWTSDLYRM